MVSHLALIRAANLDHLLPRVERWGCWTWDANKVDVWISADGRSVTVVKRTY